jgi:hypothetical protein
MAVKIRISRRRQPVKAGINLMENKMNIYDLVDTSLEQSDLEDFVTSTRCELTFLKEKVRNGNLYSRYKLENGVLINWGFDKGGYSTQKEWGERVCEPSELVELIKMGELPIPRWSTKRGFDYINLLLEGVNIEDLREKVLEKVKSLDDKKIIALYSELR